MANCIVVGSNGCSAQLVMKSLKASANLHEFFDKWPSFATNLGLGLEYIKKLKQDLILNKMQLSEIILDIIENWIGQKGSAATLQSLISAIEESELNTIADFLRKEFFVVNGHFDVPCNYVQRLLIPGNFLNKEKFLNLALSSSDVFIFSGLSFTQLSEIIEFHSAENYAEEDDEEDNLNRRLMIFENSTDFHKICETTAPNQVHLIHVDFNCDKWTHIKSNGSFQQLRDAIEIQGHLSEVELIHARGLQNLSNIPVCIVGAVQAGKTAMLNYIGQNLSNLFKDRTVLLVNAKRLFSQVDEFKSQDKFSALETFLQNEFCTNELQSMVIANSIQSENLEIELLLDGIDFVSDCNFVEEMLKFLSSLPSLRVWITTLPHFLPQLENCLNVFSYKIENFLENDLLRDEFQLNCSSFRSPQYYVNRMITSRSSICKDKLLQGQSSSCDVFVFDGINWSFISNSLSSQITENSSSTIQKCKVNKKYIILDHPNHFKEICKKSENAVHLIHVDNLNDKWTHIKSTANLEAIRKLTDSTQPYFAEGKLTQLLRPTAIETLVCLSDSPGMGKTILLQHIGQNLKKTHKNRTVWLAGMNQFINSVNEAMIRTTDKLTGIETTLYKLFCTNPLQKFTLSSKLNSNNVKIELLLDGLDEVNTGSLQFSFEILTCLSNIPSIRVWITTRPHLLHQLESSLNIFGHNIEPFTEQDQIHFLTKFWLSRSPSPLEEYLLVEFSKNCLSNLKLRLNTKDEDIAGIPLQCLLIGEVYEAQAFEHSSTTHLNNSGILQIGSLIELYQLLIKTKFEKYKTYSKTGKKKLSLKEINLQHIRLAVQLIYPEMQNSLPPYIPEAVDLEELLNVGLLESSSTLSDPKFIHRTVGEYFVGKFIANMINDEKEKYFDCWSYFIYKIVVPCKKITFESYFDNIKTVNFINSEVSYFLNLLITAQESKHSLLLTPNEIIQVVQGCAYGQMFNLFQLFYKLCNLENIFHIIFDRDFLYLTIRYSNISFVELAIKHFQIEQLTKYEQTRLLCLAVLNGDVSILQYLLNITNLKELITRPVHLTNMIVHECVRNSLNNSEGVLNRKMEILSFILEINENLLEETDAFGRTPLLCENIHEKLLKKLVALKANVLSVDSDHNTVLHTHVKIIEKFINSIPNTSLKTLLVTPNKEGNTPLLLLLKYVEPTPEQLDKFKGCDFNCRNMEQYPPLAVAVMNGRSADTVRNLIKHGGNILWKKGWRRKTLLHYAGQYGNIEVFNYLTREHSMKTLLNDWSFNTPVDYLIKYFVDNDKFNSVTQLYPDIIKGLDNKTKEEFVVKCVEHLNLTALNYLLARIDLVEIENATKEVTILFVLANNFKPEPGLPMLHRLITAGANVYLRNNLNETFLHSLLAKESGLSMDGFHKLVEIFVETKVSSLLSEQGGPLGNTPMHMAFELIEISEDTLELCRTAGVSLNILDINGASLLHSLAKGNRSITQILSVASSLIKFGVDPYLKNNSGTFLHVLLTTRKVNSEEFHEIVEFLSVINDFNLLHEPEDLRNRTALHFAVESLEFERKTMRLLHSRDFNFNVVDDNGETILIRAANFGKSIQFLIWLINFGANPYIANFQGQSCLDIVLTKYNLTLTDGQQFIKMLIQKNHSIHFDINNNPTGYTTQRLAVKKDEIEKSLVKFLSFYQSKYKNSITNLALLHSAKIGWDLSFLVKLVRNGSDPFFKDKQGKTFLHVFIKNKKLKSIQFHEAVKTLISKNLDRLFNEVGGSYNHTPLHLAFKNIDVLEETVNLLNSAEINLNLEDTKGENILFKAVAKQNFGVISLLLKHFNKDSLNSMNKKGENLIHTAAKYNNDKNVLSLLISNGVEINQKDEQGTTPLYWAMLNDDREIGLQKVIVLVERGADVENLNKSGESLLFVAAKGGNMNAVKFCLDIGLKINERDKEGTTPIYLTIMDQDQAFGLEKAQYLVNKGADIYLLDKHNRSLLHYAALIGNCELLEYFINHGLDIFAVDSQNQTPLEYAMIFKNKTTKNSKITMKNDIRFENNCKVLDILVSKGAVNNIKINY